jgi:4-amino-4-deoxy-L-arabinose transferase-like glycosyltransferase
MQKVYNILEKSSKLQTALLIIFASLLFILNIGSYPFIDGDATFYGQIAENMILHGDWLTLRFDHYDPSNYVDKPPLTMWIMAIMFKLFSFTEFAARIWHSILSVASIWLTYLIAKRLFSHQVAILSGIILTTSLQFFYQAREPLQDIPLALCFLLIFYFFIIFLEAKRFRYFYYICIVSGISVMIKGPVGIVIPGTIMVITFILGKYYKQFTIKEYLIHILFGLGVFLLLSLPWHIYEYLKEGPQFIDFYFGSRTINRYLGSQGFPGQAAPAYLIYIFLGMLPWSPFLFNTFHYALKIKLKTKQISWLLPIVWIVGTFFFFAISPGDIFMRYILPILPAVAIIVAKYLYDNTYSSKTKKTFKLPTILYATAGFSLLTITIALNVFQKRLFNPATIWKDQVYLEILTPFLLCFSIGFLITSYCFIKFKNNARIGLYVLICFTALAYFIFIQQLNSNIIRVLPQSQIAGYINNNFQKEVIVKYTPKGTDKGYTMLSFYLDSHLKRVLNEDNLKALLLDNQEVIVIVEDEKYLSEKLAFSLIENKRFNKWVVYKKEITAKKSLY